MPRTLLALLAAAGASHAQLIPLDTANPVQGGFFGTSVSGIPDVDGDGRGDVAVGAFNEATPSSSHGGHVYIYSGSTGVRIRTINPPTIQVLGTFGSCVAGISDLTGDGRGDLLIGGMWEYDSGSLASGRAYLYSGATGQLVRAWVSPNRQTAGNFGWAVAPVPDINGDGITDIIIAAPGERSAGGLPSVGRVYVYSGATGVWLRTLNTPNPEQSGNFGFSVAGVPDADGDGRGDILVGAPHENPGATPTDAGRAYLFSGATGALIRAMGSPYPQVNGLFGLSVAGLPDINGDGRGDVAVGGGWETPPGLPSRAGAVHLYSGATGYGLRHIVSPNPSIQGYFGASIAAAPDVNGDGRADLVVGAERENGGASESGRAYIFSAATGALIRSMVSPTPRFQGQFGGAVGSIPDTNADGRGDAAIGAPSEIRPGFSGAPGRAYISR